MAFVVLRCEKVKLSSIAAADKHNNRKGCANDFNHINLDKTEQNKVVYGLEKNLSLSSHLRKFIKKNLNENSRKIRNDAVGALEFMISASPEFFYEGLDRDYYDGLTMSKNKAEIEKIQQSMNLDKVKALEEKVIEFAKNNYGDRVMQITYHEDEKCPHWHIIVAGMTDDNRLSAKELFTKKIAKKWQDDIAELCKPLGLQRGIERSEKIHVHHNEFNSYQIERSRFVLEEPKNEKPNKPTKEKFLSEINLLNFKKKAEEFWNITNSREQCYKKERDFFKNFYQEFHSVVVNAKLLINQNEVLKKQKTDLNFKNSNLKKKITFAEPYLSLNNIEVIKVNEFINKLKNPLKNAPDEVLEKKEKIQRNLTAEQSNMYNRLLKNLKNKP